MQIISKNGKVFCTTDKNYPQDTIKIMKAAGYKVKDVSVK